MNLWRLSILLSCHWWENQNRNLKTICDFRPWKFDLVRNYCTLSMIVNDFSMLEWLKQDYSIRNWLSPTKLLQLWPILTYYTSMKRVLPLDFNFCIENTFRWPGKYFEILLNILSAETSQFKTILLSSVFTRGLGLILVIM